MCGKTSKKPPFQVATYIHFTSRGCQRRVPLLIGIYKHTTVKKISLLFFIRLCYAIRDRIKRKVAMHMDIIIRPIQPGDYPGVLLLWNNEIGNLHVTPENIVSHYARIAGDDRYRTYVAVQGSEVLGFITSVDSYAVGFEGKFVHITGLAVRERYQGQGIGTRLIQALEADMAEAGACSIYLNSGFQRTAAHAFYEHRGYAKGSYCFSKRPS